MQTLWTFKTRNFRVSLACTPEQDMDLSWDDDDGEATAKIESGEWECVTFRVLVEGPDGEELGVDYLGNSVYADVNDFRKEHVGAQGAHGSYFRDMIGEAIREARTNLRTLKSVYVRESAV